jgi:YggT family protein
VGILVILLRFYSFVILAYVLSSWFPGGRESAAARFLGTAVEPALKPIKQILPSMGSFDFSPIILYLGISFMARLLGGG